MINGIKDACSDFNEWSGCARIYYGKKNNETWTKTYHDDNSRDHYEGNSVVEVLSKTHLEHDNKISKAKLKEMIEKIIADDKQNKKLNIKEG